MTRTQEGSMSLPLPPVEAVLSKLPKGQGQGPVERLGVEHFSFPTPRPRGPRSSRAPP